MQFGVKENSKLQITNTPNIFLEMRNLLRLIYNYHFPILFLAFCGFCFFLIFQNNNFQRTKYIQLSHSTSGNFYGGIDNFKVYLSLKETNKTLSQENAELRNKLENFRKVIKDKRDSLIDTTYKQEYHYQSAKVINNTVSKQFNYITLNKGANQGVKADMAVITKDGIVGIVEGVSENYATVLPVLNRNFKVSAKLKKSNFQGNLSWDGISPEACLLHEIPLNVSIQKGDTVITTGYSSIFPEGIMIGTIKEFNMKDGSYYYIKLTLSCDLRKLSYVMVVSDLKKGELVKLQNKMKHD